MQSQLTAELKLHLKCLLCWWTWHNKISLTDDQTVLTTPEIWRLYSHISCWHISSNETVHALKFVSCWNQDQHLRVCQLFLYHKNHICVRFSESDRIKQTQCVPILVSTSLIELCWHRDKWQTSQRWSSVSVPVLWLLLLLAVFFCDRLQLKLDVYIHCAKIPV